MNIFYQADVHCDFFFCFVPKTNNRISLPENISSENFLYFLQSSLDQIKPVIIAKNEAAVSKVDLNLLKGSHCTFGEDFIFLNYSIRNLLKSSFPEEVLHDYTQIQILLEKILKK